MIPTLKGRSFPRPFKVLLYDDAYADFGTDMMCG